MPISRAARTAFSSFEGQSLDDIANDVGCARSLFECYGIWRPFWGPKGQQNMSENRQVRRHQTISDQMRSAADMLTIVPSASTTTTIHRHHSALKHIGLSASFWNSNRMFAAISAHSEYSVGHVAEKFRSIQISRAIPEIYRDIDETATVTAAVQSMEIDVSKVAPSR
jgi:hypothetical protein